MCIQKFLFHYYLFIKWPQLHPYGSFRFFFDCVLVVEEMAAILELVFAILRVYSNVFLEQEAGLRQEIVDFWLREIVKHFMINIKIKL